MKKNEIKEILKAGAKVLRGLKIEIKDKMRNDEMAGDVQWDLVCKKREWRHKQIAYCLLKGRTYEQIERVVRKGNEPNQALIEKYKEEFRND